MTDLPDLKIKALVNFPASAIGGTGVDVNKVNGNFVIDLAYEDFAPPVGGVSDPAHQNALLWNSVTDVYTLAPISLIGSGGSVPEAPNDGVQYGRQSLGWTPVASGTAVLPATAIPLIENGAGAVGSSVKYAREDHVHPALGGGPGSGNVTGPSSAVSGNIATYNGATGTVIQDGGQSIASLIVPPATVAPVMDGTATIGSVARYAREDHVHPTDTSRAALTQVVRYDAAQALTAAQQVQARQNVYAAPFDALAYNGMQINGGVEVSQELSHGTAVSSGYICDGWKASSSNTGFTATFASVSNAAIFAGYQCLINGTVGTTKASLVAGDVAFIFHPVEGYRVSRLAWGTANAQPITIGFWSDHAVSGLFSGSIRNSLSAATRSYVFTYTQATANVAQYNVITIPGDTTTGWAADNTAGMVLTFTLAEGGTFTTSSVNQWVAGNFVAAAGQVNGVAASGTIFRLTGVVVIPGIEAPAAARSAFIMRPYDQELQTCLRYFETWPLSNGNYAPIATGQVVLSATTAQVVTFFKVIKRGPATLAFSSLADFVTLNATGSPLTLTALSVAYSDLGSMAITLTVASGLVAGNACSLYRNATNPAKLSFDARL